MRLLLFTLLTLTAFPCFGQYRIKGSLDFDFTIEEIPVFPQPIAAWNLSDGTSSVGDFDLTLVNTPTFDAGKMGNAMYLDRASGQYGKIANADLSTLKSDTSFTVSAWFYPASSPSGFGSLYGIASTWNGSLGGGWGMRLGDGFGGNLNLTGGTLAAISTPGAAVLNEWNFAVLRHNTTTNVSRLWLINSGVNNETTATLQGGPVSVSSLNIGAINDDTAYAFDGRIDEVNFWSSELTDSQITYLFNSNKGRQFPLYYQQSRYLPLIMRKHRFELAYQQQVLIDRQLCGTLSIRPRLAASLTPMPVLTAELTTMPRLSGSAEIESCP